MNLDQFLSLVRTLLKFFGGYLTLHGASKAGAIINAEDTIGLLMTLIGWVASHFFVHANPNANKPNSSSSQSGFSLWNLMASVFLSFVLVSALLTAGCASFNTTAFRLEKTTADGGAAAVHSFNSYYQAATNGMPEDELAKLNAQRTAVYLASRRLGASLSAVESLRADYERNLTSTNRSALQIGLTVASDNLSNLVWLAQNWPK
jgi:hypothetical protein